MTPFIQSYHRSESLCFLSQSSRAVSSFGADWARQSIESAFDSTRRLCRSLRTTRGGHGQRESWDPFWQRVGVAEERGKENGASNHTREFERNRTQGKTSRMSQALHCKDRTKRKDRSGSTPRNWGCCSRRSFRTRVKSE